MSFTQRLRAAGLLFALLAPGVSLAADFDGSKKLICAAIDAVACVEGTRGPFCSHGSARTFDLPEFFTIDFKKSEIRATGNDSDAVSPIRNQEKTATQVIMQGVENDRGWTVTVEQEDGSLMLATSGGDLGIIIYGACTAP